MNRFSVNASVTGFGFLAIGLLHASSALAATTCKTTGGTVVTIVDPTSCHFETSGGCTALCTPVNVATTCSTMCTASAAATCTDTCQTQCETACTTMPTTFTCKQHCTTDCTAGCMASCTGSSCAAECSASCDTQCTQHCTAHPGSTDCTTECGDSCSGSCTVQANIMCNVACTTTLTGGCTTRCAAPSGALFCDGQYIDVGAITDCTFSIGVTSSGSLSTTCTAAPGNGSPFGVPAGIAGTAGLALLIVRRRRHA